MYVLYGWAAIPSAKRFPLWNGWRFHPLDEQTTNNTAHKVRNYKEVEIEYINTRFQSLICGLSFFLLITLTFFVCLSLLSFYLSIIFMSILLVVLCNVVIFLYTLSCHTIVSRNTCVDFFMWFDTSDKCHKPVFFSSQSKNLKTYQHRV